MLYEIAFTDTIFLYLLYLPIYTLGPFKRCYCNFINHHLQLYRKEPNYPDVETFAIGHKYWKIVLKFVEVSLDR